VLGWKAIFWVGLERSAADLSDGVTIEVVGGLWWHVVEWAKSLGGAWRRMIWTMAVILVAMEPSALDFIDWCWQQGDWTSLEGRSFKDKNSTADGSVAEGKMVLISC
jgi:hypothetical protein